MCRDCLVSDGYLVVPPPEMDVFMDLGHLERVQRVERKFVAMAFFALHILKLLLWLLMGILRSITTDMID
jgi:hypothetical protein